MTDNDLLQQLIRKAVGEAMAGGESCHSGEIQCQVCPDRRCPERDAEASGNIAAAGADRIGSTIGVRSRPALAAMIDHTLLKPDATETEINQLCDEARDHSFASVCVNPVWVGHCRTRLGGSSVMVATVIGFPLGALPAELKAQEALRTVADGADELDMVMNIGFLKSSRYHDVEEDIRQVVHGGQGKSVKVIIETSLLTDEEKVKACVLSQRAGAHFVKTSTGFSTGGATAHDIALMRQVVGPEMGVKASGGIKSSDDARKMIAAGASRIGASASVAIVGNTPATTQAY